MITLTVVLTGLAVVFFELLPFPANAIGEGVGALTLIILLDYWILSRKGPPTLRWLSRFRRAPPPRLP